MFNYRHLALILSDISFLIDINATNNEGNSGIKIARMYGYREIVKFMIDASEEFDIKLETPETDLSKLSFGGRQSPSRTESTDPDDDYVYY